MLRVRTAVLICRPSGLSTKASIRCPSMDRWTRQVARIARTWRGDVDRSPHVPLDFGQNVSGFQDDFSGVTRDPNWVAVPSDRDDYKQADGVLRVTTMDANPCHLLCQAAGYDAQCRKCWPASGCVRALPVPTPSPGFPWRAVPRPNMRVKPSIWFSCVTPVIASEYLVGSYGWWMIRAPGGRPYRSSRGRTMSGLAETGPDGRTTPGRPRTPRKIWRATVPNRSQPNGRSSGLVTVAAGWLGIRGPHDGSPAECDLDYILIKAEGLPQIQVAPAACRPARKTVVIREDVHVRERMEWCDAD